MQIICTFTHQIQELLLAFLISFKELLFILLYSIEGFVQFEAIIIHKKTIKLMVDMFNLLSKHFSLNGIFSLIFLVELSFHPPH